MNATGKHSDPQVGDAQRPAAPSLGVFRIPLLWSALAIDTSSRMASAMARGLTELAASEAASEKQVPPEWGTRHRVVLELEALTLRDFSREDLSQEDCAGPITLICPPLAFQHAMIADLAPGHSVVASLRDAQVSRLFVVDWKSATREMRFKSLDSYFSDLNVIVDHLASPVNLIGLCQGGWMALAYTARFPEKVSKLVLVGAPIDISAQETRLSAISKDIPLSVVERLVALDHGIVSGVRFLRFWAPAGINDDFISRSLQLGNDLASDQRTAIVAQFTRWFWSNMNLSGRYFLDVVDKVLKRNGLVSGELRVLGEAVDLANVRSPLTLIAADRDEVVGSEQLFSVEKRVSTARDQIHKITVQGNHLSLFMGAESIRLVWPHIGRWLAHFEPVGEPVTA